MSPRSIRAARLADRVAPRLWAFAYPPSGRGWRPLRLVAVSVWAWWFRRAWRKHEAAHWER
jgi:hypothetical protein